MEDLAAIPPLSGQQILAEWANEQDHWVRSLVDEVLQTRSGLVNDAIERAYALLLAEKELSAEPAPAVAPLSLAGPAQDLAEALHLRRLSEIHNVNALAPGQEIAFNNRMTVLFGENACGKSGYVRILKRLAGGRSPEPILPNVREIGDHNPPCARLTYRQGDTEKTYDWNDEAGVSPFTRISIFDSRAVTFHVDEDIQYLYTPSDLALFPLTHQALDAVKGRLEHARDQVQPQGNPFLPRFVRDTPVYAKVETLGPSTDLGELEVIGAVSDEEAGTLDALRERVEALRPQIVEASLSVAKTERELFEGLDSLVKKFQAFDWSGYSSGIEKLRDARERYVNATERAFAKEGIPGGLGDAWRAFIQAGEEYIDHIGHSDYPHEGDACLYCRQPLGTKALDLVTRYRELFNSELKREIEELTRDRDKRGRHFADLELSRLETTLAKKAESESSPVITKGLELVRGLLPVARCVSQGEETDPEPLLSVAEEVVGLLKSALAHLDELVSTLQARKDEREKAFAEASTRLRNLEARLTLRESMPDLRRYVERARWASKASIILSRFPPLLRSLTELAKSASERLLNEDFERCFTEECRALNAPSVSVDFPGRKGEAARRKTLVPAYRLSEILSEGEQNVIALADFLAEASLRRGSAPLVFDDPVTSLDFKRLNYVVERLVALSEYNQVVVFTHNIWFAVGLLSKFEDAPADCGYYEVCQENSTIGVVREGTGPKWDTPKKIRGRINTVIQQAGGEGGEGRAALIERGYSLIRSWCEAFVEQELLCGVTQRFQPHVAMTKLPQIKGDRLQTVISVIHPIFEKACRLTEAHSQPLETLSVRPTLDELKGDWKKIEEARASYIN